MTTYIYIYIYIYSQLYYFFLFLVLFFFSLYGSKICNLKMCLFGTRINLGSLLKEKQKNRRLGSLYFYLSFSCLKNLDKGLVDWNTKYTRWELWVGFHLGQNYSYSLLALKNKEVGERSLQFSSVTQLCPTLCNSWNAACQAPPVHHQLPEFT